MGVTEFQILKIGGVLNDTKRPIKERFRALFTLRNIGGHYSLQCINECFNDSSVLLKHELAYCLGQMQDPKAVSVLLKVLEDVKQDPIVRHEAAEALGAIGDPKVAEVLERFLNDSSIEVAETCEIAVDRLKWIKDVTIGNQKLLKSPYASVDPAPPSPITDVIQLKDILLDESSRLFERYRAMFALRNLKTSDAVVALGEALSYGSSLFRHEIAFVLGQVQHPDSVPFLIAALEDDTQHEMVRHECAEALGAIASEECITVLKKYLSDDKRIVRESCEVALDMCEYENSPEFQYANTLGEVRT